MDYMSNYGSWAQGFGWYEQIKVMDDINVLGSRELKPLDVMNH